MTTIDIIAGARPNFMKIAPIIHAIHSHNETNDNKIEYRLIHTGQHFDKAMSESFFQQLHIPEPHLNLGAGGGSQAEQTAAIMIGYEKALEKWKPQICLVVGDVTSTMACAIVAKKACIQVVHVEGGIRSGDITMPEEINRIVTDSITDYFFTTSEEAGINLLKEGKNQKQIFFVGNTMIDSLMTNISRLRKPDLFVQNRLYEKSYLVATLHRPSNVDNPENLARLLSLLDQHCGDKKVIFPMHPRTKKIFQDLDVNLQNIIVADPMPYLEFIFTVRSACGIITDSGGITEEATVLGIPCLTLRTSTERPETVSIGTNELAGTDSGRIKSFLHKMVGGEWKKGSIPPLWDGKAAERIINVLKDL